MSDFFNRAGEPISMREWGRLHQMKEQRIVAQEQVGSYWVSTVWLGLDHGIGMGPPVLFETMVFPGDEGLLIEIDTRRYCTEQEARVGHEETMLLIRATMQDFADEQAHRGEEAR